MVENWALSSECFDAELDLTRMLSPSFYVVPHNTQDPPAPAQANSFLHSTVYPVRNTIPQLLTFANAGLVRLSTSSVASQVNVDTRLLNRICFP